MFQRILVPLDGSKRAERALPVAARIARHYNSSIILVRIALPPSDTMWYTVGAVPAIMEEHLDSANTYLKEIAASKELADIKVETEAYTGLPAEIILMTTKRRRCDLLVMCSHGHTGFTRWMLGSVAQKVARHSTVPVLILRRDGVDLSELHIDAPRSFKVMVALDGSSLAEESLAPAAYLSDALSAPEHGTIHLARVLPLPANFEYGQHDRVAEARERGTIEAEKYLDRVQKQFREGELGKLELKVTTSITVEPDIAKTLIGIAEHGEHIGHLGPSDVLAMATHGRTGPARWVMGSVAERVLGSTGLPLLIVRPVKSQVVEGEPVDPMEKEEAVGYMFGSL